MGYLYKEGWLTFRHVPSVTAGMLALNLGTCTGAHGRTPLQCNYRGLAPRRFAMPRFFIRA